MRFFRSQVNIFTQNSHTFTDFCNCTNIIPICSQGIRRCNYFSLVRTVVRTQNSLIICIISLSFLGILDQGNGRNVIAGVSKCLGFIQSFCLYLGIQCLGILVCLILQLCGFGIGYKTCLHLNKCTFIILLGSQGIRLTDDGSNLFFVKLGIFSGFRCICTGSFARFGAAVVIKHLRHSKNSSTNEKHYCQNSRNHCRHFALFLRCRTKGVDSRCGLLIGCNRCFTDRGSSVITVSRLANGSRSIQIACTNLICTVCNTHESLLHFHCGSKPHIRIIRTGTKNQISHGR